MYFNSNKDCAVYWQKLTTEKDESILQNAFDKLKPETQMVLLLHYGEGYKFKDIAFLMRLSESVIRNHHSNGIYDLYRFFNPRVPGELFK
jgi:DNA-directed RNA polymerase specialized sigma24 family protein